jgi:hypothetical protein
VRYKEWFSRAEGGTLAIIGFILSPLSWWNDIIVNFPISYAVAFPFGLVRESLFIPAFVGAYWLTNILGLLMMQKGGKRFFNPNAESGEFKKELRSTLMWGTAYTGLILVLLLSGVLSFPSEFLERIK